MGFLPSQNNCIIWNVITERYEAWALHSDRGMFMFSFDRGVNGQLDPNWVVMLWGHMVEKTDGVTNEKIRKCALSEFAQLIGRSSHGFPASEPV